MVSYGTTDRVYSLAPAIGVISATSTPTILQTEDWLEEGYAAINQALAGAGYVIPVSGSAAITPVLRSLNVLYATAYALRARGLDVVEGLEETRSEMYLKDFWSRLKALCAGDLTNVGVEVQPTETSNIRRGLRSIQLRRVDGFSAAYGEDEDDVSG